MENNYCVYMHTLKLDGRKYIGLTKYGNNPEKRWKNGKGYGRQSYFYNAIEKYGWESFKHEILFENLSKESACNKEKALIKLFNTTDHNYGFNIDRGGFYSNKVVIYDVDDQILYNLYYIENKTAQECATFFGVSVSVIKNHLQKFPENKSITSKVDLELLYNMRYIEHKSCKECAEFFGVSVNTITDYSKRLPETRHEAQQAQYEERLHKIYQQYFIEHKTVKEIATNLGVCVNVIYDGLQEFPEYKKHITAVVDDQILYNLYYVEHKSRKECAEYFGVTEAIIKNHLHKIITNSEVPLKHQSNNDSKYNINDHILTYLYIVKNKTNKEIATYFGVPKSVINWKINKLGLKKSKQQSNVAHSKYIIDNEVLYQLRYVEKKSVRYIADYFGIPESAIKNKLHALKNKGIYE